MLVYVAGKYRDETYELVAWNVKAASDMAAFLLAQGMAVVCPHSMTGGWERYSFLSDADFLRNGLEQLRRCDAVLLLDGWEQSEGTLAEIECADENHIPVFKTVDALLKHFEDNNTED